MALPASAAPADPRTDLTTLTAAELQSRLASGEVTAVAVTEAFLARIAAIDDAGPALNAVVEINPGARAIAAELDAYRAAHGSKGPLHGLPVLLKANIDTGDAMATHAGSLALVDHRAPRD